MMMRLPTVAVGVYLFMLYTLLAFSNAEMRSQSLTLTDGVGVRYSELLQNGHATYKCESSLTEDVGVSSCSHTTTAACIMSDTSSYFLKFDVPYPTSKANLRIIPKNINGNTAPVTLYVQAVDIKGVWNSEPKGTYGQSCDTRCAPACSRAIGKQITFTVPQNFGENCDYNSENITENSNNRCGEISIDVAQILGQDFFRYLNQSVVLRISAPDVHTSSGKDGKCEVCPVHPTVFFPASSNTGFAPVLDVAYEYPSNVTQVSTTTPMPAFSTSSTTGRSYTKPTAAPRTGARTKNSMEDEEHQMRVTTLLVAGIVVLVVGVTLVVVYFRQKHANAGRYGPVAQYQVL